MFANATQRSKFLARSILFSPFYQIVQYLLYYMLDQDIIL